MWPWDVKVPGEGQLPPPQAQMQRGRRERQQDVGSGSSALGFPGASWGGSVSPERGSRAGDARGWSVWCV